MASDERVLWALGGISMCLRYLQRASRDRCGNDTVALS